MSGLQTRGATVHTTAHKGEMHSLKKVTGDDSITMGNGIAEKAALIGELTGTICDKSGDELTTATMSDVVYLPTGQFNLFSLTKMKTNQGWILGGDDKGIWLTSISRFRPRKVCCLRCTSREKLERRWLKPWWMKRASPSNWHITVSVILTKI
jgi:hypothetical protein